MISLRRAAGWLPVVLLVASCSSVHEVETGLPESATRGVHPGVPPVFDYPESGAVDATTCGDYNGTPDDWVFVTVETSDRCELSGSYIVFQNSKVTHRLNVGGHHIVVRDSEICCGSAGALVSVRADSHDIAIVGNDIHSNGSIPSKTDRHGVRVDGNTTRVWILDNHIHDNSGDGIQFCHSCIGNGNGPANVWISGNVIHDDEENAIDLKEFRGPVVVTCNEMYGYEYMGFSGHGEAFRVNDEGSQGELWSAHNTYHDNVIDVLPGGSDAESYFLDERGRVRGGATAVADGESALRYYRQFEQRYGIILRDGCDSQ